jgi:rare lipoprotein A
MSKQIGFWMMLATVCGLTYMVFGVYLALVVYSLLFNTRQNLLETCRVRSTHQREPQTNGFLSQRTLFRYAFAQISYCAQRTLLIKRMYFCVPTIKRKHGLSASLLVFCLLAACAPATQSVVGVSTASAQSLETSEGRASWYGAEFAGRRTANGEIYDPSQLTAAHKTLPFGTFVRVTNPSSGASVVVRINDRGPFKPGRVIDVSRAAAEQIGMIRSGTMVVRLELISGEVQSQAVAAGNVILAADAGLSGYNVIASQYRVGQLLLLSSPTHPQPIIVRVASVNMPVSSGVQMFAPNDLFNQLGDKITVTVGN